ncbi:MAG: acetate--CoA ligase family protein [Acidobacteria bacterium]|nr:acetate--CoA ligase family protein [Acidobacteriota bacterium]
MRHPLDYILRPRSIAVVGASRQKDSIGQMITHNLIELGFNGKVFPVNPHADVVHSIKSFPNVQAIPDEVDLAIIVVPKEVVLKVVDDCLEKGVGGFIVITAGFKETGQAGAHLEQELVKRIKARGLRMIGPNCMGVINTEPDVRMNATFAPIAPWPGRIAFMSQSGALGVAMLNIARRIGLGFSMFVSMGNKADVSGNDLLEYWENDPNTDVILMYLESFGNPRKFTQLARHISRRKPIIALKAGRTAQGAVAASSHTGALAGLDFAADALFHQCGVLRAYSVEELFDLALAFGSCPIPQGDRVAIISNAGGPAIMATDACVNMGLKLTQFSSKTITKLKGYLPEEASVKNPVDLIASANADSYRFALDTALADRSVDAAIVIFVPPIMVDPHDIVDAIAQVKAKYEKSMLGVFMATEETLQQVRQRTRGSFPIYLFPESAARALAAMAEYHRLQERPEGGIRQSEVSEGIPRSIFAAVRNEGRLTLNSAEALSILSAYGIPTCLFSFAATVDEAVASAEEIGYPVVLKLMARNLTHKSDVGGVIVDIRNNDELVRSYQTLMDRSERHGIAKDVEGVLVQQMVRGGREVVIGLSHDPQFGPLIMFGLGGIYVETLRDVAFRVWPITDIDATEMIESIRSFPILKGTRGEDPVDFALLEDTLMRVSQLVGDFPEIAELDINPFIASHKADASKAVDARISLKPRAPSP